MHSSTYNLPGSAFVVLTGNINDGKTWQMTRLLEAAGEDGEPLVAPILVIPAESSGEGTAGDFYADPSKCLVWGATTCDDAFDILGKVFPDGRAPLTLGEVRRVQWEAACELAKASKQPPPPAPEKTARDHLPIRAVAVDSISTLYAAQMTKVGNDARAKGSAAKAMKSAEASAREQAKVAAPRCIALIDRLNGITQRHRGTLIVVACHVRKQVEQMTTGGPGTGEALEVHRSVVGWAPDLGRPEEVRAGIFATGYAALWQHLAAKANIIWHLFAEAPDFRQVAMKDINVRDDLRPTYGAITMRGTYATLGQVMWAKRQGGSGWLGFFDALPPYWHQSAPWEHSATYPTPDLGAVLSHCVATWREGQAA